MPGLLQGFGVHGQHQDGVCRQTHQNRRHALGDASGVVHQHGGRLVARLNVEPQRLNQSAGAGLVAAVVLLLPGGPVCFEVFGDVDARRVDISGVHGVVQVGKEGGKRGQLGNEERHSDFFHRLGQLGEESADLP